MRPSKLKLDTHMDSGWMYCVYHNQTAAANSSLYFFIFLSLQFSNIKHFHHSFLWNCEANKIETWHNGWVYRVYRNQNAAAYLSLYYMYFIFFLSNSQSLNVFFTLSSGTVRCTKLKLDTNIKNGSVYCVYWNQAAHN